jgi:hydrogenase/urease accessory protein HupE
MLIKLYQTSLILLILIATCFIGFNSYAHGLPDIKVSIFPQRDKTYLMDINVPKEDFVTATNVNENEINIDNLNIKKYFVDHINFEFQNKTPIDIELDKVETQKVALSPAFPEHESLNWSLKIIPKIPPSDFNYKLNFTAIFKEVTTTQALIAIQSPLSTEELNSVKIVKVDNNSQEPIVVQYSLLDTIKDYIGIVSMGFTHILFGFDHLLFLIIILIPTLKTKEKGIKNYFLNSAKLIGCFTIGHTISLCFATFGYNPFNPKIIEVLVVLTLLFCAFSSIFNRFQNHKAWIMLIFGLIHGFAFSESLSKLALSSWQLFLSVLSFNFGIEIIQLSIVAICVPIFWQLIKLKSYNKIYYLLMFGTIITSFVWLYERVIKF